MPVLTLDDTTLRRPLLTPDGGAMVTAAGLDQTIRQAYQPYQKREVGQMTLKKVNPRIHRSYLETRLFVGRKGITRRAASNYCWVERLMKKEFRESW